MQTDVIMYREVIFIRIFPVFLLCLNYEEIGASVLSQGLYKAYRAEEL